MTDSKLNAFLTKCEELMLKTTNCPSFHDRLEEAKSATEAVAVFRLFWQNVVDQIPDDFLAMMDEYYQAYREDIVAAGVYYNESPSNPLNAIVFVGNSDEKISVSEGKPKVVVLGKAEVAVGDHVRCECHNADASVTCQGYSRLRLVSGTAYAFGRSFVEGSGIVHAHDCCTVRMDGGELFDHGHLRIKACNNAIIHSFTHRGIEAVGNAQLIIDL